MNVELEVLKANLIRALENWQEGEGTTEWVANAIIELAVKAAGGAVKK